MIKGDNSTLPISLTIFDSIPLLKIPKILNEYFARQLTQGAQLDEQVCLLFGDDWLIVKQKNYWGSDI